MWVISASFRKNQYQVVISWNNNHLKNQIDQSENEYPYHHFRIRYISTAIEKYVLIGIYGADLFHFLHETYLLGSFKKQISRKNHYSRCYVMAIIIKKIANKTLKSMRCSESMVGIFLIFSMEFVYNDATTNFQFFLKCNMAGAKYWKVCVGQNLWGRSFSAWNLHIVLSQKHIFQIFQ